ncbi:MAG: PIN domain-containing protein [Solirubrobacteraceae bacterium]
MTLLLDAGAFIALERGDPTVNRRLKRQRALGSPPMTHGGIVGQVWRDGTRQARLAMWLAAAVVVNLDEQLGRASGALLARTGGNDVLDAALVLLAQDGDTILTSDAEDLAVLAAAAGRHVDIIPV